MLAATTAYKDYYFDEAEYGEEESKETQVPYLPPDEYFYFSKSKFVPVLQASSGIIMDAHVIGTLMSPHQFFIQKNMDSLVFTYNRGVDLQQDTQKYEPEQEIEMYIQMPPKRRRKAILSVVGRYRGRPNPIL